LAASVLLEINQYHKIAKRQKILSQGIILPELCTGDLSLNCLSASIVCPSPTARESPIFSMLYQSHPAAATVGHL
jgi:hypothetical protein